MMKIIDEHDTAMDNFCEYVCSSCVNGNDTCEPFGNCDWNDDFQRARFLLSKLFYLEDDPDCLYGTSDDDYDLDAQGKAYNAVDEELDELQNGLIHEVQEDQIAYHRYYAYEL